MKNALELLKSHGVKIYNETSIWLYVINSHGMKDRIENTEHGIMSYIRSESVSAEENKQEELTNHSPSISQIFEENLLVEIEILEEPILSYDWHMEITIGKYKSKITWTEWDLLKQFASSIFSQDEFTVEPSIKKRIKK